VFKESERGLTRSPTTLDQTNSSAVSHEAEFGGAGQTDRSYGRAVTHDQVRRDRDKKDEGRKKLEPSMKWRVLERDSKTDDTEKEEDVKTATKPSDKQLRIKSSGHARFRE